MNTKKLSTKNQTLKKARLEVLLREAQKDMLVKTAIISDSSLQKNIKENQLLKLSKEDKMFFAQSIINPPEPSHKLKSSAERYLKIRNNV